MRVRLSSPRPHGSPDPGRHVTPSIRSGTPRPCSGCRSPAGRVHVRPSRSARLAHDLDAAARPANEAVGSKGVSTFSIGPASNHPLPGGPRHSAAQADRRSAGHSNMSRAPLGARNVVGASGVGSAEPTSSPHVGHRARRGGSANGAKRQGSDGPGGRARRADTTPMSAQASAARRKRSSSRRRRLLGRPSPRLGMIAGPASGTTGGLWST